MPHGISFFEALQPVSFLVPLPNSTNKLTSGCYNNDKILKDMLGRGSTHSPPQYRKGEQKFCTPFFLFITPSNKPLVFMLLLISLH